MVVLILSFYICLKEYSEVVHHPLKKKILFDELFLNDLSPNRFIAL